MIGGLMRWSGSFGAIEQFAEDNRAKEDISRAFLLDASDQFGLVLAQPADPRVGIEKVGHQKGSRSSSSPCGGRSKSPCQEPAMESTQASHSALVSGFFEDAG